MKKTEQLFSELSELIPEIKNNPEKWKAFVSEMLEKQPPQSINENFKKRLKNEILSVMKEKKGSESETNNDKKVSSWFMNWRWALGGFASMAFIFVISLSLWNNQNKLTTESAWPGSEEVAVMESAEEDVMFMDEEAEDEAMLFGESIAESGGIQVEVLNQEMAFGDLDLSESEAFQDEMNMAVQSAVSNPAERGGGGMVVSQDMAISPSFYGGERINFNYKYTGESLENLPDKTLVYGKKLQSDPKLDRSLKPFLDEMNMGVIDLKKFSDLEVRQITLSEKEIEEVPHQIYLDFYSGNININPDYEVWHKKMCPSEFCDYEPLTKADIPSDQQMISWANSFLNKFDVSLENTGQPIVQKYWEMYPEEGVSEPEFYSDSLSVIFPHMIDEKPLMNGANQYSGISVEVNIRYKEAISAQIPILRLESSAYPARSAEAVLELAGKGGSQGVQHNNPDRTVELELDTPKRELRRIWQYENGQSQELMMEVLVFPVIKDTPNTEIPSSGETRGMILPPYYSPQEILVPLAETL